MNVRFKKTEKGEIAILARPTPADPRAPSPVEK
jgi:hypothetical protein